MQVEFKTASQNSVTLDVPTPSGRPSFFVFSLYKAGSVLQDKVFEDLCAELNIPMISLSKVAFAQGVDESTILADEVSELFSQPGYCFYGFRCLPRYLKGADLSKLKKVLLVRDPRDMLVSHYFSMKKSHPIPGGDLGDRLTEQRRQLQEMDINDYVLDKAPSFLNLFEAYQAIDDDNLVTFRYEDIVFEKSSWISNLLNFLQLELEESKINEIAKKHDIFPKTENPSSHVRKVSPGDHKDKLEPETIGKLNQIFASVLKMYKYS